MTYLGNKNAQILRGQECSFGEKKAKSKGPLLMVNGKNCIKKCTHKQIIRIVNTDTNFKECIFCSIYRTEKNPCRVDFLIKTI